MHAAATPDEDRRRASRAERTAHLMRSAGGRRDHHHAGLGGKSTNRCGDLSDRDESARFEHRGPRQDQDGPLLGTDLRNPDLAARHSWLHASASRQNGSHRSGWRWYAARSDFARAVSTAAATPSRAAAEMLIPNCRARCARSSSSVKVVRVEAIPLTLAAHDADPVRLGDAQGASRVSLDREADAALRAAHPADDTLGSEAAESYNFMDKSSYVRYGAGP